MLVIPGVEASAGGGWDSTVYPPGSSLDSRGRSGRASLLLPRLPIYILKDHRPCLVSWVAPRRRLVGHAAIGWGWRLGLRHWGGGQERHDAPAARAVTLPDEAGTANLWTASARRGVTGWPGCAGRPRCWGGPERLCRLPGSFGRGRGKELHPATRWMVELGALCLRTETELVLKSRRVVPGRLVEAGFAFDVPEWPAAATDLVVRWRQGG